VSWHGGAKLGERGWIHDGHPYSLSSVPSACAALEAAAKWPQFQPGDGIMKREFEGKHVLITGAASGIGRQTAFSFADRGASLVLCDIDANGLERTALLCRKLGVVVQQYVVDVASASEMERLAARVHDGVPALDILINNAGVGVIGSFVGTELPVWDWAISINLKGVVHGCHFFVPKMIERGQGGHVVNVASLAGLAASKRMSVYSATKFAVVGLSESLRAELTPHGISVTTVCPGVIDTPITSNARLSGDLVERDGYRGELTARYRRRDYQPGRVAEAIVAGVRNRRGLLPVAPESWAIYYAKRLAPSLVEALLTRDADSVLGAATSTRARATSQPRREGPNFVSRA
jgi:NAD(P)-dependent dehydrogenase (short-subunit alcohol dehydrogenase family)